MYRIGKMKCVSADIKYPSEGEILSTYFDPLLSIKSVNPRPRIKTISLRRVRVFFPDSRYDESLNSTPVCKMH